MRLGAAADAVTCLRARDIERGAYSDLFNLQYYNLLSNELDDVHFLFTDLENPISAPRESEERCQMRWARRLEVAEFH